MGTNRYEFLMYERAGVVVLDPLGTVLALMLVLVVGLAVGQSRLAYRTKKLIYAALALRVVGALARYVVLFAVYRGSGDARAYYSGGLERANALWMFDFATAFGREMWVRGKWHGTNFVYYPSTVVHALIGPSMPGGFIVFSLFAFIGLCGFALAFHRTYPEIPVTKYARWIWLFPALWFWPSSIGKESIVLMGLGLAFAGYIGRNGRINWFLLGLGVFFVFGIRPQVAAVLIFSFVVAHWLSLLTERWTVRTTVQAALLVTAGIVGLNFSLSYAGIDSFDVEGVQTYMEGSTGRELGGGSQFDAVNVGVAGIPLALLNILFRPFIWESRNPMVLISCLEIMAVWGILFTRRRVVMNALRHWRHDRLLQVAIPFILAYSVSLGMVINNMGVVARQRIFIFPFIFLLVEVVPRVSWRPAPSGPAAGHRPVRPGQRFPLAASASR